MSIWERLMTETLVPWSRWMQAWYWLTIPVVLLCLLTVPLDLAFYEGEPRLKEVDVAVEVFFLVDMLRLFVTGYAIIWDAVDATGTTPRLLSPPSAFRSSTDARCAGT